MRLRRIVLLAGLQVMACGLFVVTLDAADAAKALPNGSWPSFRGPAGTGVAPDGDPPSEWSETKNLRWKVPIPGEGHATPIIWKDRIYLLTAIKVEASPEAVAPARQETPAQPPPQTGPPPERPRPTIVHQFAVIALDRATGQTVWTTVVAEELPHEPGHETASQASASPVTDGERLYAFFGSRGLFCLDMEGAVKWKKDLGDMRTRNEFGEGASPALHGDTLLVNWDHEGEDFIVALDKRTGDERWRVSRDEPTSWSTPVVLADPLPDDPGRALVVVSATNRVRAYDVKSGTEVWSVAGLGANCIPTPVAANDLLFVMSGYRNPAALAIRFPGAKGDITGTDRIVWKLDRGTSYVSSPLLYDGRLYFLDRLSAVMHSHELATGKPYFTEQRLEGLGNVYGSLAGASGRIYVVDRAGKGAVLRHGETFQVIGTGALDDQFDASPVIAGDALYLRGHKHFYCIGTHRS